MNMKLDRNTAYGHRITAACTDILAFQTMSKLLHYMKEPFQPKILWWASRMNFNYQLNNTKQLNSISNSAFLNLSCETMSYVNYSLFV